MRFAGFLSLAWLFFIVAVRSQTAPPVTNIRAVQHDGQTFVTWTDAANGAAGERYRYDLYRSTSGPITDLSRATLVQEGIYNNSAQLIGAKPFNQKTRQNTALPMVKIQNGGPALPVWSGLAVCANTEKASAFYAVITRDNTKLQKPSPLAVGNTIAVAVAESPAPIQPVLQVASNDAGRKPSCCVISGSAKLPLWLRLHGSGGSAPLTGDLQAYWGDSSMGFQDGIQSMFAMYEDHGGNAIAKDGVRQLVLAPQDAVWSIDGNSGSETFWFGYRDVPPFASDRSAHVYPFTQAKLGWMVPWAVRHYGADPNRIYGVAESMGGYGQVQWALRQANLFAAIFMRIPVLGPWMRIPSLIDLSPTGMPRIVATTDEALPGGGSYNKITDTAAWVARDCSRNLPYVSWSSGRNDATLAGHRMWTYAFEMAKALKTCHYGFSFVWNDGVHNSATAGLENTLLEQYQTRFSRDVSYPAFTNFSLDDDYGRGGHTEGAPSGCVNCGWRWKVIADSAECWSASFTNTHAAERSTTDVTPRNTQSFKRMPGTIVYWSTTAGQMGKVVADSYGLVTVKGIDVVAGSQTVLTLR